MRAIEIKEVSKSFRFGKQRIDALKNVSFSVNQGEVFGLLGPNGAGKTTLLNIMTNLLLPDKGEVKLLGTDPAKNSEIFYRINSASPDQCFHWLTRPKDILFFYSKLYNIRRIDAEKRIAELSELFSLQKIMNSRYSWLSTGERMRVAFSKALLNKPELLLLDEPTLGLDPDIAVKFRKYVQQINEEQGTTILLTSHYMHEVEQLCKKIAFIYQGRLLDVGEVAKVKLKHFATFELRVKVDKVRNLQSLRKCGFEIKGNLLRKVLKNEEELSDSLAFLHETKNLILDVKIKKPTLEDYFIKMVGEAQ